MPEEPGANLDLRFPDDGSSRGDGDPSAAARPWIGILFDCCHVYQRVYRPPDVHRYVARCPRCGREATIEVADHGTKVKFLRAND